MLDKAGDPVDDTCGGRGTLDGSGAGVTIGGGLGAGSHGKVAHLVTVSLCCQVYQPVSRDTRKPLFNAKF